MMVVLRAVVVWASEDGCLASYKYRYVQQEESKTSGSVISFIEYHTYDAR